MLNFRNYADLVRDTLLLAPKLAHVDAIVGVPRSGMLPASILACHMHKPLAIVTECMSFRTGARLDASVGIRTVAIVDDSVLTGRAMRGALGQLQSEYADDSGWHGVELVTAGVYVHPDAKGKVDAWAVELPDPRGFEWNLFGSELIRHSLLDIDGVLCPDPPMMEEDEAGYADYLASAPVLYRPLYPVAGLVTNRLERWRDATEAWLAANRIEYGTLTMAPFATADARRRMSTPADLKSAWYAAHDKPGILVESHDNIAAAVARNTGKPCISLQSMRCFQNHA